MALEKWLMCSVERFISLKVQEVMHVNCCSGTKSDQPQGADRWSRREQHSLGLTCVKSATEYPLCPQRGTSGYLVSPQEIRKGNIKRVPDPEKLHPKAMREFTGGFSGQLKVIFVKIVENGKLPESWKEINVLISPRRKKKLEFRN